MQNFILAAMLGILIGCLAAWLVFRVQPPSAKKPMKSRTKFVMLAVSMLIVYTIAVFVFKWFERDVPPELTTCWFAAWTVELALLAGIKIKDKE